MILSNESLHSPYPTNTASVLSRTTLVVTTTTGVIQAKILYFTSAALLPPVLDERATCPVIKVNIVHESLLNVSLG